MTAKDLKNALLQEAVQGKLVPQIASEGNARDLMEEIRKEKLSHGFANSYGICDGKNKKSKSSDLRSKSQIRVTKKELPEITEDEIPFEIPENWCWCRLGELAEIITKGSSPSWQGINYVDKGILFVTSENVGDEELLLSKRKFLEQKFNEIQPRSILQKGDILTNIVGASIGRTAIFDLDIKNANINQAVALIRLKNKQLNSYIVKVLNSKTIIDQMTDNTVNTARANISLTTVENFKIPLPPLAEQKRIVAAIEKFMPLIEEYGKKETELKTVNEKIGTLTKKAILQEAVQGKLVPQIATEGNAKDLLEEIKKEKAKVAGKASSTSFASKTRAKEFPPITDDEIPFDIPENWRWCRLGEICNEIKRGKSPKYADKSNFLAFAQKCNVKTGGIDLSLALYLDENSIGRYSEADNLIQDDIVINSTGGGTMGRVGLYETKVPAGIKGVYPDSHVIVIRSIGNINQHYLYYVLKLNQPELEKCGTGSTNQTELKPAVLADFVIPLPPLAEQKRIVTAIEKMLSLCKNYKIKEN